MKQHTVLGLLSLGMFASQACKKEYIDKIRAIAADTVAISGYNYIQAFDIPDYNKDTTLTAAISNDSIIVYWPSFKKVPDSIHPMIALPDSATVQPLSGTAIALQDGIKYTVTSAVGTTKQYTLYLSLLQPPPTFAKRNMIDIGMLTELIGSNFMVDTGRTKVTLVAATDSTEYPVEVTNVFTDQIQFIAPLTLPAGNYDIKVVNGKYTIYNSVTRLRYKTGAAVRQGSALFNLGYAYVLKHGSTFDVRGLRLQDVKKAALLDDDQNIIPLDIVEIVSQDRVRLKVRDDVPVGKYTNLALFQTEDQYLSGDYIFNSQFNITITQ